jgi:uncharacterized protein
VAPGARRTELVGRHGEGWRVRVAAPPEGGRANAELTMLLAELLDVPRAAVHIAAGRGSRDKLIEVHGIDTASAAAALDAAGR